MVRKGRLLEEAKHGRGPGPQQGRKQKTVGRERMRELSEQVLRRVQKGPNQGT